MASLYMCYISIDHQYQKRLKVENNRNIENPMKTVDEPTEHIAAGTVSPCDLS